MIRQATSFALFLLLASFLLGSPSESRMVRREASGETQTPVTVDSEEPEIEPKPSSTESSSVGNEPETPEGNEITGNKPEEESSKTPGGDVKGEETTKGGEEASQSGEPEEGEASQGGESEEEVSHGGQPGDASQSGEPGEAAHDEELGEEDSQGGELEEEYPDENGGFDHHMIHTGFIFDSPIFSFEAAENYFRQLENAMHEIFKKAMSEANAYPDNYKNTTYDEFTVNGQKYRVQKTVIKQGGVDNSTLLIKAVSAIPVDRKRRSLIDSEMWTI